MIIGKSKIMVICITFLFHCLFEDLESLCFSTTNLDKAGTSNKNALDDLKIKSENKWEDVNVQQ